MSNSNVPNCNDKSKNEANPQKKTLPPPPPPPVKINPPNEKGPKMRRSTKVTKLHEFMQWSGKHLHQKEVQITLYPSLPIVVNENNASQEVQKGTTAIVAISEVNKNENEKKTSLRNDADAISSGGKQTIEEEEKEKDVGQNEVETEEKGKNESDTKITISVQQRRGEEAEIGTGAMVWDVAIVFCHVLAAHPWYGPRQLQGKTVLDLGSGTGVTGIAAAAMGAKHVLLTDMDGPVLNLQRENVKRNNLGSSNHTVVEVTELTWGKSSTQEFLKKRRKCKTEEARHEGKEKEKKNDVEAEEQLQQPSVAVEALDYILVCECIVPRLYPIEPLVETLYELLTAFPFAKLLVGYEHRIYPYFHPGEKFSELLLAKFMTTTNHHQLERREIPLSKGEDGVPDCIPTPSGDMFFWEFARKGHR